MDKSTLESWHSFAVTKPPHLIKPTFQSNAAPPPFLKWLTLVCSYIDNVVLVWLQKGTFSFSFFQGCPCGI